MCVSVLFFVSASELQLPCGMCISGKSVMELVRKARAGAGASV